MANLAVAPAPPPGFELIQDNEPGQAAAPPPPGFELVDPEDGNRDTFMGKIDTVARGAADLASFGLADEIAAGGDALFNPIFGTGNEGESIGDRYSKNLESQRATDQADEQGRFGYRLGGQIVGGVGGGVAIAKGGLSLAANAAQSGKGWMARLLGGSADGAIAAGAYGAGSGEGIADRAGKAAQNVPWGAGMGLLGETAATGAGALYRRGFQGAGDVAPGVNPAANVADAEQFGIPLSRAQATRSVPQSNIENQLRSQGAMSEFDTAQRAAVGQSVDDVQSRLAGSNARIPGQASAYDDVPTAIRGKRDALKTASQDAYEASVNNPDVLVSGEAVRDIPDFIRGKLEADQILIDPMYHQGASRAMSFVDDYIARMPKPGGQISDVRAQLRWVENMRAGLRKNFPPIGQDAPALKAISSAIDDWTDDVFERGLVNASDDVLSELKTARSKWSEYKAMAEPRSKQGGKLNPRYEAQARLRSIADKDMSPEEVGKLLWGSSVASPKASAFMTAQELKKHLGADSPHWSGVRQSFWLRATRAGDETMNPAQIVKNLDGLLKGDGKGIAQVLFSPEERQMMTAYANVMRALSPARQGLNHSNTANRLLPTLQKYATGIVAALAAGGGHMGGLGPLEAMGLGAVTGTAMRGAGSVARSSRVNAATRMPVPVNPSGYGGAVARGAPPPLVLGQEKRQPLEITVGRRN